jgi:hypothetical protein
MVVQNPSVTSVVQVTTAITEGFNQPRQLSDGNSQGTVLGISITDLISFYGATPVAQPTNVGSQLNTMYNIAGTGAIMKYQIGMAVNALTATTVGGATLNQTSSVTSMLQVGVQFATNSVYAVNKPTLQAGLGIAGVYCATTGIINVNYANVSSGSITPTQEANDIIEIKASPLTTSASLTPAAVAQNNSAEQIFTITGNICQPGTLALVNKPTSQIGLGYSPFARVVAPNQVGITFFAITSGTGTSTPVTPTAAETYNFAFLPQLNAFNPTLIYGVPVNQNASAASTWTVATSTITGLLINDTVSGLSMVTTYATTGPVNAYIATSSVISVNWVNLFGAQTAVSNTVMQATIQRQAPLNPMMIYSQALATSAIAATTSAEVTSTVTGLVVSSSVLVNKPSVTPGLVISNARVSAANTLAVQYMNLTTTSINVPTETYTIGNVQIQGPGLGATTTAGLFVIQSYFPSAQQSLTLANATRAALVSLGLMAGT